MPVSYSYDNYGYNILWDESEQGDWSANEKVHNSTTCNYNYNGSDRSKFRSHPLKLFVEVETIEKLCILLQLSTIT